MNKNVKKICALLSPLALAQAAVAGNAFVTTYVDEGSTDSRRTETLLSGFVQNTPASKRWKMFEFSKETEGFGDVAAVPFGDQVEYKIDAINYNLHLGDESIIPFQLYYADLASTESPEKENKTKLLDPTQGFAVQFPIAAIYKGRSDNGGFCNFNKLKGYCVVGGDLTLRGVQLNETDDAGKVHQSTVFGASASLRAAALFPIFEAVPGTTDQAGHLSISLGGRYYYHNSNNQNLLFEKMTDPNGNPIEFKKSFSALSAESEFDIYKHFKIRLEYFKPLDNRDSLDDVFKASIVVTPAKSN